MALITCPNCKKLAEHHAKGLCFSCYRKVSWKPKPRICKRCGKEKVHHAKGYCKNCFNIEFCYDHIKRANYRRWHNVDLETYREITKSCTLCGFNKIVDLHHLDGNHDNNSKNNLIGLCPNHHKMIHMIEFKEEILSQLKQKGFETGSY